MHLWVKGINKFFVAFFLVVNCEIYKSSYVRVELITPHHSSLSPLNSGIVSTELIFLFLYMST
jgi:hypothetical protein